MYSYSSWKNYWEGTLKRENLNLGKVSTQMFGLMGNYGLTRKINLLFSAPYVKTKASAGTLHGMKGIQDLSLFVKWRPFKKRLGMEDYPCSALQAFHFRLVIMLLISYLFL